MNRFARFATTVVVSGGLGLAGLGLGAGIASAGGERHWCPGDDPRGEPGGAFTTSPPNWDWNVCHSLLHRPGRTGQRIAGHLGGRSPASATGGVLVPVHPEALLKRLRPATFRAGGGPIPNLAEHRGQAREPHQRIQP